MLICTTNVEGKVVGTLGAGRIGFRVLQRLKPFDCKELLCEFLTRLNMSSLFNALPVFTWQFDTIDYDYAPLPEHAAKEVGARRVEDLKEFLSQCAQPQSFLWSQYSYSCSRV